MGGVHKGEEKKTNNTWQKKLRGIREFEEYLEKKSVYCTREVVFK